MIGFVDMNWDKSEREMDGSTVEVLLSLERASLLGSETQKHAFHRRI